MKKNKVFIKKKALKTHHQISLFHDMLLSTNLLCHCKFCLAPQKILIQKANNSESEIKNLQTNFGIKVKNNFIFLLLHLRNQTNRNPINVKVPQIGIFHQGILYDMIYTQNGHIRSRKFSEQNKVKKLELCAFFRKYSNKTKISNEHYIAKFFQNQYAMLSDFDLVQLTYKSIHDPIWMKLQYIQNKLQADNYNYIKQFYDHNNQYSIDLIKIVTQSMLGQQFSDKQVREQLSTQDYFLNFLNLKICFFLNFHHNIRIKKCTFIYVKAKDSYILINAEDLQFQNLTQAIRKRHQKQQKQIQERNKILFITQQKAIKNIEYQTTNTTNQLQKIMNKHYSQVIQNLNLKAIDFQKGEDFKKKNQQAYLKLFPKATIKYEDLLIGPSFQKRKDKVLQICNRKSLITNTKNRIYKFSQIKIPDIHQQTFYNNKSYCSKTNFYKSTKNTSFLKTCENLSINKKRFSIRTQISES